jgi:hypothetical protein
MGQGFISGNLGRIQIGRKTKSAKDMYGRFAEGVDCGVIWIFWNAEHGEMPSNFQIDWPEAMRKPPRGEHPIAVAPPRG